MTPMWERRERRGGGGFGGRGGGRGGFGGRDRFNDDKPKPVKEGEVHTVTISEVSRRGDGIARIKNFVIFVPGTQKGDVVKVKIRDVRGNHATGDIVSEGEPQETTEEHAEEVAENPNVPQNSEEQAEPAAEATEETEEKKEEFA